MLEPYDDIPMRELETLTGFPRATILYYIKEGLLPEPRKTAKNMAHYDRRFVDGLRLIRELKEKHNLSLPQIKHVLQQKSGGVGAELLLDVRDRMFRQLTVASSEAPIELDTLREGVQLDDETLSALIAGGILIQESDETFHPDNVAIGQMAAQLLAMGIPIQSLSELAVHLQTMARLEMTLFAGAVSTPMLQRGEAAQTITDSALVGTELLQSLVSLLHLHTLHRTIQHADWFTHLAQSLPPEDAPETDAS